MLNAGRTECCATENPGASRGEKERDAIPIYPERGAPTLVLFASARSPGDKLTKWPLIQGRLSSRFEETSDREINAPRVL